MSVRFSVLPADLAKGDVVRDLNGHTVESVQVNDPEVIVNTIGPDGRLHTWKCNPADRLTILDW